MPWQAELYRCSAYRELVLRMRACAWARELLQLSIINDQLYLTLLAMAGNSKSACRQAPARLLRTMLCAGVSGRHGGQNAHAGGRRDAANNGNYMSGSRGQWHRY